MVRNKKAVDLTWFDYTPEVLVWGQVKLVLRRYKLKAADFKDFIKWKAKPLHEGENGDLSLGFFSSDLKLFLKKYARSR